MESRVIPQSRMTCKQPPNSWLRFLSSSVSIRPPSLQTHTQTRKEADVQQRRASHGISIYSDPDVNGTERRLVVSRFAAPYFSKGKEAKDQED